MGFKSGFVAGLMVGLILLGIVLLLFSYWAYQIRVEYDKQAWQLYQLTHSQAYQDIINGLQSLENFFNTVAMRLSSIRAYSLAAKAAL